MVHVHTLKVDYQRNPRDCKLILQEMAAEMSTEKKTSFSEGTRNEHLVSTYTRHSPATDVRAADFSIGIGKEL